MKRWNKNKMLYKNFLIFFLICNQLKSSNIKRCYNAIPLLSQQFRIFKNLKLLYYILQNIQNKNQNSIEEEEKLLYVYKPAIALFYEKTMLPTMLTAKKEPLIINNIYINPYKQNSLFIPFIYNKITQKESNNQNVNLILPSLTQAFRCLRLFYEQPNLNSSSNYIAYPEKFNRLHEKKMGLVKQIINLRENTIKTQGNSYKKRIEEIFNEIEKTYKYFSSDKNTIHNNPSSERSTFWDSFKNLFSYENIKKNMTNENMLKTIGADAFKELYEKLTKIISDAETIIQEVINLDRDNENQINTTDLCNNLKIIKTNIDHNNHSEESLKILDYYKYLLSSTIKQDPPIIDKNQQDKNPGEYKQLSTSMIKEIQLKTQKIEDLSKKINTNNTISYSEIETTLTDVQKILDEKKDLESKLNSQLETINKKNDDLSVELEKTKSCNTEQQIKDINKKIEEFTYNTLYNDFYKSTKLEDQELFNQYSTLLNKKFDIKMNEINNIKKTQELEKLLQEKKEFELVKTSIEGNHANLIKHLQALCNEIKKAEIIKYDENIDSNKKIEEHKQQFDTINKKATDLIAIFKGRESSPDALENLMKTLHNLHFKLLQYSETISKELTVIEKNIDTLNQELNKKKISQIDLKNQLVKINNLDQKTNILINLLKTISEIKEIENQIEIKNKHEQSLKLALQETKERWNNTTGDAFQIIGTIIKNLNNELEKTHNKLNEQNIESEKKYSQLQNDYKNLEKEKTLIKNDLENKITNLQNTNNTLSESNLENKNHLKTVCNFFNQPIDSSNYDQTIKKLCNILEANKNENAKSPKAKETWLTKISNKISNIISLNKQPQFPNLPNNINALTNGQVFCLTPETSIFTGIKYMLIQKLWKNKTTLGKILTVTGLSGIFVGTAYLMIKSSSVISLATSLLDLAKGNPGLAGMLGGGLLLGPNIMQKIAPNLCHSCQKHCNRNVIYCIDCENARTKPNCAIQIQGTIKQQTYEREELST